MSNIAGKNGACLVRRNSSWRDLDILVAVALLSGCQNAVALLCQNSELACLVPIPLSLLLERLWGALSQRAVTLGGVLPTAYLRSKIFDVVRDLRLGNNSLLRTNPDVEFSVALVGRCMY